MNNGILEAIKKGELILFLGAGASFGCHNASGKATKMPVELAKTLAAAADLEYHDEALDVVYQAAQEKLGARMSRILEDEYRHTSPSRDYEILSKYSWRRIYTLNIDDGLDHALIRNSEQRISKFIASDPVEIEARFFEKLQLIKLNGSADQINRGLIFSPSEYARAAESHNPWYSTCASDFVRSPILFIGTQLNEPLLKFHIERYQALSGESPGISYLIAKDATPIQIQSLKKYKIEFIKGTLSEFVSWLKGSLGDSLSPLDLAYASMPQLRELKSSRDPEKFAGLFDSVLPVTKASIGVDDAEAANAIRDFYKGFKPSWSDITKGVPAELAVLGDAKSYINSIHPVKSHFLPILGPAGSGKTTLLMQLCWYYSQSSDCSVYFLDAEPVSFIETLIELERTSTSSMVVVAVDDIELMVEGIKHVLESGRLTKTIIIGSERESTWNKRGRHVLAGLHLNPCRVSEFTHDDATRILDKLKLYGSWTRLGKMSQSERISELVRRARKQLLIALMEATLGRGFEQIIESDYNRITSNDEKLFLAIVAVITDRRIEAPVPLLDRALDKVGILRRAVSYVDDLAGIVHETSAGVSARHPVYARYLIDRVIDPSITARAINGILQAFSDYRAPVIQNVSKSEAALYKSMINHKFLFDVLKGSEVLTINTYRNLEKKFESDGLFWLQYGLSLRDFQKTEDALDKLRIARDAYPMPHTLHALAQQLLKSAEESSIRAVALALSEEARGILEGLDDVISSDDTYPIVTLAEGHTKVVSKHVSDTEARSLANRYSLVLGIRSKANPQHERLRLAYERLFNFAATGVLNY
ncbi:TPA: SIR2 family protein [Stenotrophomonas maltophilia]